MNDSHNSTAAQRPAPDGTACIYGCIYGHLEWGLNLKTWFWSHVCNIFLRSLSITADAEWASSSSPNTNLFPVVILQSTVVAFFQPFKHQLHVVAPPDLRSSESHLSREVQDPLLSGLVLVHRHSLGEVTPDAVLHRFLQTAQPCLHLQRMATFRQLYIWVCSSLF